MAEEINSLEEFVKSILADHAFDCLSTPTIEEREKIIN